ncbi:class I SAM-dependent methyltransferase [Saccharopolyspora sp. NPDC002686]|uniref:class I SAM-dependent methyltransferase n=1 Tax=Saccharopolyspora sp. NPDC002686 TaxID=3154541 RepID=UPI00332BE0DA
MSDSTAVDPSNVDQLRAWDGNQGEFWTSRADRFNEGVAGYQDRFLDAAEIDRASTVLDIGCGSGQTTRDAARRAVDGSVLGVDLSSSMIELARRLAARDELSNVAFEQVDAQVHDFPEQHFDVAISRHGVMFFGDPLAAFRNIARAVRPGGRLALLTWQPVERIEWMIAFRTLLAAGRELPLPPSTGPSPFSLSDPDAVRELLSAAGFDDVQLHDLAEPMYFGRDVDDACDFIAEQHAWLLADLDADDKSRAIADLRADLADHQTERGVLYDSAAWLVEARRR